MYKQALDPNAVIRIADGVYIPKDSTNSDYVDVLRWEAEGNELLPPDPPPWRDAVWADFRTRRDVYMARLDGIAGRSARAGDLALAAAADAFSLGLLDVPQQTTVQDGVTPDQDSLEAAIFAQYRALTIAGLGSPPDLTRKAIFDKVFN